MTYIDDIDILNEPIETLELKITTVDADHAESKSKSLFVNVVFSDGTRLYEPFNFKAQFFGGPFPLKGGEKTFKLPVTHVSVAHLPVEERVVRSLGEIAEVFLRKTGTDGWFMGSVLLFANGHGRPLIGNRNANQFLDNAAAVLLLREWSTASLCVAPAVAAKHPLPRSGYRVLGPVLGQVSENSAVVLYRIDREGRYRFIARDPAPGGGEVFNEVRDLEPTGRFELQGLQPDHRYDFELKYVRAGEETTVPDAAGSVRTYPKDGTPGTFSFAFGSCARAKKQAGQGSWTGIRRLADPAGTEPVRLFAHLGDTFYFYDDMTKDTVANVESMHAAHVSMRRHIEFLDMARVVPCCGIWDDHDFAKDNADSTSISSLKDAARDTWLKYWGNQPIPPIPKVPPIPDVDFGLSTRITHGLVDLYLLDGRYYRDKKSGVYFGNDLIDKLLGTIRDRGKDLGRVVVLATGSSWTNELNDDKEYFGHSIYATERKDLFGGLDQLMGSSINGLILLSGDSHFNEIYHVNLVDGRMAPEFTSSPLTRNSGKTSKGRKIEGERVASFPTKGDDGRRGFATLTIDTSNSTPEGNWTATVRYYQEAAVAQYEKQRKYRLTGGHFLPE